MKTKIASKTLSLLLAFCLVVTMVPTAAFADGGDEAPSILNIIVKRLGKGKISIQFTPSNMAGYSYIISEKDTPAPTDMGTFIESAITGDFYIVAGSNQLDETNECVVYIQIVNAKNEKSIMYSAEIPAYVPIVNAEEPSITGQPQAAEYEQGKTPNPLSVIAEVSDGGTLSYQWYKRPTANIDSHETITGAVYSSYTPSTAELGSLYYYCEVTNTNNDVNGDKYVTTVSNIVEVKVTAPSTDTINIISQGDWDSITDGGNTVDPIKINGKTIVLSCDVEGNFDVNSTSEITFAIEGNNKTINGGITLGHGADLTLDNVKIYPSTPNNGLRFIKGGKLTTRGTVNVKGGNSDILIAGHGIFVQDGALTIDASNDTSFTGGDYTGSEDFGTSGSGIYMQTGSLVIESGSPVFTGGSGGNNCYGGHIKGDITVKGGSPEFMGGKKGDYGYIGLMVEGGTLTIEDGSPKFTGADGIGDNTGRADGAFAKKLIIKKGSPIFIGGNASGSKWDSFAGHGADAEDVEISGTASPTFIGGDANHEQSGGDGLSGNGKVNISTGGTVIFTGGKNAQYGLNRSGGENDNEINLKDLTGKLIVNGEVAIAAIITDVVPLVYPDNLPENKKYNGTSKSYALDMTDSSNWGPWITAVTVPADGTYTAGETLDFTFHFNEEVTVDTGTGLPFIVVVIGSEKKSASYTDGSTTKSLTFSYTVQTGDYDSDGIIVESDIRLNGGTIKNSLGKNADLTFAVPNEEGIKIGNPPLPVYCIISGTIKGSDTNAGIYDATVDLKDYDGNIIASTKTNANGQYSFSQITAGTYSVDVSANGYRGGFIREFSVGTANISGKDLTLIKTGGSSSGGSGGSGPIINPPASPVTNVPAQGSVNIPGTVDARGNMTANITNQAVSEAISKVLAQAKQNGTEVIRQRAV